MHHPDPKAETTSLTQGVGGSLGIGKATVKLFLSKGAHVVNGDLYPGDIESNKYEYVKCDVSSWQSQLSLFKKTLELHGRIDVVIANAGTNESEQALQNKVDAAGDPIEPKWTTINVNLIGCLITVKLSLHYLQKQSTLDSLIITGSLACLYSDSSVEHIC